MGARTCHHSPMTTETSRNNTESASEAPTPDAKPAGTTAAWGSCSAEPYWLEVAEELGLDPEMGPAMDPGPVSDPPSS